MKKSNFLFLMFASLIVCFNCSQSFGQDEMPLNTDTQKLNNLRRRGVLEELNLSQTQVREIRRINQEKDFRCVKRKRVCVKQTKILMPLFTTTVLMNEIFNLK